MLQEQKLRELEKFALTIRIETLKMLGNLGFGHLGGSMSIVELLSVLYGHEMNIDPKNPKWEDRDWLICSKGHAGPAVYSTLALKGYFPMEELKTLNKPGTNLPSHCDRNKTIGVDATTGSLGQGSSQAVGIALGNRMSGKESYTYLILGDGESQEGQVWEAVMMAAHQKLDHLIAFVDDNKQQLDGFTKDINHVKNFERIFESYAWDAVTVDGHSIEAIYTAISNAKKVPGKPHAIILDTVKGKGIPFVEGVEDNHHIVLKPELVEQELERLTKELEGMVV
jgi:transketolase